MKETLRYQNTYFLLFLLLFTKTLHAQVPADTIPQVILGDILVEGNHRTRTSIITRELAIKTGDTIRRNLLAETLEIDRRKIINTNLFITVEVFPELNQDSIRTNIRIVVKERWYFIATPVFQLADRNFNEWWYDRNRDFSRIIYGVYMSYGNVTGRADKLRVVAEFGFIPKFEVSYSLPYLDKAQKTGITVGASYSTNKTMAYRTWRDKLSYLNSEDINKKRFYTFVSLTRRNKYYTFHSLDLRWSNTQISDTIAILNPNYLLKSRTDQQYFQLTYSFSYDKRDNFQYPLRGKVGGIQVSKIGLLPSDKINQAYVYGSYKHFFQLSERFFANSGIRARASLPQRQPYLQTIGLGYRNDLVRGYELYVVDGQNYGLLKNELKYKIFSTQKTIPWIPIRQFNTIPLAAYLNTFADAAYVKNSYPELSNTRLGNKFIYGAGAGVDIVTFYNIVARFNLTVNGKGERRFFFNIGREF
ncbi:Surface antigen variable number repeat-containing protein [Dyadobacter koreensis]|uniref:Surface antigen variable number repeat-containing protein n=1 Tax=Dyadobacter koreensis TaxID=408657 RepID=A0A1H6REJ9_9BACT|nr:BamA/TamA family outer membrane protein [Dyadobacter koreensis]SEI50230.1 Surface antigen variable number repeat-containing protein [Dyadobacter koreensis]